MRESDGDTRLQRSGGVAGGLFLGRALTQSGGTLPRRRSVTSRSRAAAICMARSFRLRLLPATGYHSARS